MTVQVALTFPDFAAAQAFFVGLGTTAPTPPVPVEPEAAAPAPVAVEPVKAKPRRKPTPKVEPVTAPLDAAKGDELPASLAPEPADPEPAPPKVWTLEEVRAELQKVSAKFGIDAVREIVVGTGGIARISDVPADKYAAVVEAAIAKVSA